MKPFIKKLFLLVVLLPFALMAVISCDDDPGVENRYTSTSEYASDYLQNREQFSEFVKILSRSNKLSVLGTYGNYTVFAPTNAAVTSYLAGLGMASVDELTTDECDTIAKNHIIENAAYFTTDYNDGTYPQMNMLDRTLTVSCDSDTVSVPGQITLAVYINKSARMIQMDDSVENGVVHTLNAVLGANNNMLPDVLSADSTITLFVEALELTHMSDSLQKYIDYDYENARSSEFEKDSTDWTNDKLVFSTASEYDNVAYMKHRYYMFTAFVPQNSVFAKYGVTNIDELIDFAKTLYDPAYPEDADVTDYTDRRNSLNRFISYHLLDRKAGYYELTCVDGSGGSELAKNFNRTKWDIADWYETMMPHSILKCSYPYGGESGLYVNRRSVQSRPYRGYKVRGALVLPTSQSSVDQTAVNGVYHYIDDVLSYGVLPDGTDVQSIVFGERLRIDCATLSPDFMTSGARGHYTRSSIQNGKYGIWDNTSNHNNTATCIGFQPGSAKNFEFDDNTHIHVRPRVLSFWSYQGDEVTVKGRYDLKVKLPPVPEGDWEVRMFTCVGFNSRGIVQYYLGTDNGTEWKNVTWTPQGIPFDMRPGGTDASVGWISDSDLGDEESIAANDKQFHYNGWMKGMSSYGSAASQSGGGYSTVFRNFANTLRKVIGVFHSNGQDNHYLRLQQKIESETNEMNFDMIELCPSSVYNNLDQAEDRL